MKKTLIGCCVVVIVLGLVYFIAKGLVHISYNSEDIVFDGKVVDPNVLESVGVAPTPDIEGIPDTDSSGLLKEEDYKSLMEYDLEKYNMGYEDCIGIPNSVYNPKDLEARQELFLGDKYESYIPLLSHIQGAAEGNFSKLNYNYFEEVSQEDYIPADDYVNRVWEGDLDSCNIFKFYKTGSINDSGIYAVGFLNDYYVVYELPLDAGEDSVFIVVDYSKTGFSSVDTTVGFGGILGTVYVSKNNAVYEEYMGNTIIYTPMWEIGYYDKNGRRYTGQDLIDMAGKAIDW